ncbi:RNA polymerase sigma factor [Tenacibaculum jejuense]|uniref:RNA polymerase ECF-type sigma factor n=1 Tax=Tenacibaculum jejuense TaxID=584609 RepID=A0A238UHA9_9FLAO|nr:sigma-70 family RNA polymerase sigma factor [Tenacibaculum jejuense]SNR17680.1 conserved protein of unknown function [Tenacibaculum jejuense]
MNDSEKLQRIKKGDTKILKEIYTTYREPFLVFGKKFSSSDEDILDVYQDAIIAFREQVLKGKTDDLNCTLKTYLFGIGKYMIFDKNRKQSKEVSIVNHDIKDDYDTVEVPSFSDTINLQQRQIQKALLQLGKKCKEVLTLFYYNNLTIEEIKDYLKYDNKNVVKSQKSRCLKQLKSKING